MDDPDGWVRRYNAAICEAGYPGAQMFIGEDPRGHGYEPAPPAVVWQAMWLASAGEAFPCWSCWDTANRAHPLGRLEELVTASPDDERPAGQ